MVEEQNEGKLKPIKLKALRMGHEDRDGQSKPGQMGTTTPNLVLRARRLVARGEAGRGAQLSPDQELGPRQQEALALSKDRAAKLD